MNNIHKAILFYFSGTGNAKQIAVWLTRFAAERNIDTRTYDTKNMPW